MNKQQISISIVCPFYNEEDMVNAFMKEIFVVLESISRPFEIVCVNDGSSDNTLEKLLKEQETRENIKIINLSRNFGKEAALTAGLDFARGEAIIPIDADLQDPPALIKEFIAYWDKGYDVVLAKRTDRSTDSFGKRMTAQLFYKVHNKISSTQIPENAGDFRLVTRKVISAIQELPENQRFMKGIFAWVGFKTAVVEYKRNKRKLGKTSFNGWKLWNFALEGFTSFSTVPLRVWLYLGLFISLSAFCYGSFIIIRTLIFGIDVPGYASLLTTILFLGGVQMIGIGVIGEYIGRMYMESKRRPPYIIDRIF
ncbi:glycosyltransferase family 2 protein [Desulfobacula sp.]|uniref:glycosyltransferase family 2 protein n=1 Tax=Desulfobacula sp. TaxID=2593537 RepID=UPI002639DC72|nr:glycosyltransferase family 2 protein [Desulfobacula sp.]